MNEIYWLTRLDGINTFLTLGVIFCVIYVVVGIIVIIIGSTDNSSYDNIKDTLLYKWYSKNLLKSCWIPILITIIYILTPTTKEMLLIQGIGGTLEYLQNNDAAKQLPDKTLQCLDKLINDYLNK